MARPAHPNLPSLAATVKHLPLWALLMGSSASVLAAEITAHRVGDGRWNLQPSLDEET